jgi:hypothetical protein
VYLGLFAAGIAQLVYGVRRVRNEPAGQGGKWIMLGGLVGSIAAVGLLFARCE